MAYDAVVVGAGITGLTAAHRMSKEGARVVLVERSGRLGGIVQTTADDGFLIEAGPDSFVTGKERIVQLADELGLASDIIPTRPDAGGSYVWWDDRLHPLPGGLLLMVPSRLGPFLRSSLLSSRGKLRALADLVLPRSQGEGDESLDSFVRRRFGPEVLERIAEPLIAGIHAAEPETMSLQASFPRFLEMETRHRSLILAARRAAAQIPANGGGSHFSSFRLGMGQLTSALAGALGPVQVRTGTDVVEIDAGSVGYTVSLGDGSTLVAPAVVVATPAPVATRLLATLSPDASRSLSAITQTTATAVTLAYRSDDLPPLTGTGFVVPSVQNRRIRGVSYLSRKWEGRVPSSDHMLIRVFFGADREEREPVGAAVGELEEMLGIAAPPVRDWVHTHTAGLHRYTLGHLGRVAAAERALEAWPGIRIAGAGFHGVGLSDCVGSGQSAADGVLQVLAGSRVGR